jgi:hypothetical protein
MYNWGQEEAGRTFFFTDDIRQSSFPIHMKARDQIYLRCGDRECLNTECAFNFISQIFVYNTYGSFLGPHQGIDLQNHGSGDASAFSDRIRRTSHLELSERNIIMGSDEEIQSRILSLIEAGHKDLVLESTCMNKVLGSDLQSILRRIAEENDCRLVYDHNEPLALLKDFTVSYSGMLTSSLDQKPEAGTINLVGYRNDPSMDELISLIRSFGIRLNQRFLPMVDLENLSNFNKAELSVVQENPLYEEILKNIRTKKIHPRPPFGFRDSIAWIESILSALDIKPDDNSRWKKYKDEKQNLHSSLRKQASAHTVGLIISEHNSWVLTKPQRFLDSLDLLDVILEMGFSVIVMITAEEESYESISKTISSRFQNDPQIDFLHVQDSIEYIKQAIEASHAEIFCSDLPQDPLITGAGKNVFSSFLFEKGVDGAIRTQKSLLNLCKTPFYRTYKKHQRKAAKPSGDV